MKYLSSAILWLALWHGAGAGVRAEPAPPVEPELESDVAPELKQDRIDVALHGPVPFGRAELQDALLPRLDDASIDTRASARGAAVEVSNSAGGVLVRVGARERTLSLGERTGPGAARVVALVILDLLLSEGPALPMPLALPPAEAAETTAGTATAPHTAAATTAPPATGLPAITPPAPASKPAPAGVPVATARPTRPKSPAFEPPLPPGAAADVTPQRLSPPGAGRPPPELVARPAPPQVSSSRTMPRRTITHVRLSGFGGALLGSAREQAAMISAGADVRLGLGSWRAGMGLSWLHLPTTSYEQVDVGLEAATLRLDAGRAFGDVELTAAAFAMPSRLHTDVSGLPRDHHAIVLYGGGAAMRAGARLGRSWRLVTTLGVDVFGRRLRVRTLDDVLTSTPLMTISLTVGVSWEVMP